MAWVTRWGWPRRGWPSDLGEVEPLGGQLEAAGLGGQRGPALVERGLDGGDRLVDGAAGVAPLLGGQRAEAGLAAGQRAALAEHLGLDGPQLVEGRGAGDRVQSGRCGRGRARRPSGQ